MSLLRDNPRFRLLWTSNLFFFGGVWTQTLVLGWLVYEMTRSDFLVAVFTRRCCSARSSARSLTATIECGC